MTTTRFLTGRNGKPTNVPADNASMRHSALLVGSWFYSRVTLSCGCVKSVANPQREITVHDPWYCGAHLRPVTIVRIELATIAEQDALCQPVPRPASEPESEIA